MTVSIIIAVADYCENLKECVNKCRELDFSDRDYEIWILSDIDTLVKNRFQDFLKVMPSVNIFATGNITPPFKRDLGAKRAKGKILAFLDDDAYPAKEWLKEAVSIFSSDESIACVCGPAVTPLRDSLRQKASGLVYGSRLVSGNHRFRYIPWERSEVSDFPSCNFLIRKDVFDEVGGFDKPFWPGEDTFLCLKVLETGKKMVYDPKVLVYHHRRPLFKKHLVQIKNYAYHRGYFVKKYPRTSFRPEYFIPSFFVIGIISGAISSIFLPAVKAFYFAAAGFYLSVVVINARILAFDAQRLRFLVSAGIITTHLTYGIYFLKGLFADKMPEEAKNG